MVDFITEVEEELRKDDYNRLLKKYGPFIALVLFLIVAGAAFIEWRKYSNDKTARQVAAIYTAADESLEDGDVDSALAQFSDLGETGPSGYAGLAYMRAAAIEQDKGNLNGAILFFDQAEGKFQLPRHKQLAELKAAYLAADLGAFSDVIARLEPLIVEGEPYEYLARELIGYAYQETDDLQSARQQFSYLTSVPGVPENEKTEQSNPCFF